MIRLAVRCPPQLAERVLDELVVIAPNGVEEDRGEGWVEYAVYGAPGELPDLGAVEALAGGEGPIAVTSAHVPDDWADRWRDFHRPVPIGDRLVVRPSWARATSSTALTEVVIDPGQAFGTGGHATTAMCLELLLELADAGEARGPLVDLGTGSGVLAIAAAKLGWGPVIACDSEPAAIEATSANARLNGVELEVRRLDLRDRQPVAAPTAIANLTAPLLVRLATQLAGTSTFVCSGLLGGETESAGAALADGGLEVVDRRARGDWAALLCRRASSVPASG